MKKSVIILFTGIFGLLGCSKILDVQSYTSITDATAFATPDRALLSLHGVYDAAQSGPYTGGTERRGYPFGSASIEQNDCRGEDALNIAAFYAITYQATYNPSTANNVAMWDNCYSLINKANVAIDGFRGAAEQGIIPEQTATQYEAECRFLRAMSHLELVVLYARPYLDGNGSALGIPYRELANTSSVAVTTLRETPRPSVAENYTKLLEDLDFAENNLPASHTGATGVSTYRATKAAAIALKMRVKLYMGDYAGVITEGAKITSAAAPFSSPIGGWKLTESPDGAFNAPGGLNSSEENVFSIKNDPLDAVSVNGSLAGMLGPANLGARGLVAVSPIIWNNEQWLCDDKRRTLLYTEGSNANGRQNIFTLKYHDYASRGDYAPQIRYAEILLTLAEAEARQASSVSQKAISLLNAVRDRALANAATQSYTTSSFATKEDLVKAILLERRVEFLLEGRRWPDISRLAGENNPAYLPQGFRGIPGKSLSGLDGLDKYVCGGPFTIGEQPIPYSDFKFVWPIPANEVVQNPVIEQNPNY